MVNRALEIVSAQMAKGIVLGEKENHVVCIPKGVKHEKNVLVCGKPNCGKTTSLAFIQAIQCIRRGELIIISKNKHSNYNPVIEYAKQREYEVCESDKILPGNKKMLYVINTDTQGNTTSTLSNVVNEAHYLMSHHSINLPINFIIDDIASWAEQTKPIDHFSNILITSRNRKINFMLLIRKLSNLKVFYPNGMWKWMLDNFFIQTYLGSNQLLDNAEIIHILEKTNGKKSEISNMSVCKLDLGSEIIIVNGNEPITAKTLSYKSYLKMLSNATA